MWMTQTQCGRTVLAADRRDFHEQTHPGAWALIAILSVILPRDLLRLSGAHFESDFQIAAAGYVALGSCVFSLIVGVD